MKPERLGINSNTTVADKTYKHWFQTFNNFLESLSTSNTISSSQSSTQTANKFNLLINYIEPNIYEFISKCETYDQAIETLRKFMWHPKMSCLQDLYYSPGNRKQEKV